MLNNLKLTYVILAAAILVNFSGLFITIIGSDGTLYASIAKTMALHNNYSDLFVTGKDWLDKPHLPFWLTAFFFEIFGIHTWSYKLPGILCMMMGVFYTYRFAKELYNKETALWAAIILLTAEHIILSNNDVRAEPYLTGFIIAAIYHFYRTLHYKSSWHLVAGAFFTALAIMTKGMFALIPVAAAIGGEIMMKNRWKELLHARWLAAAALILLFITPELYCLYNQFDQHPEKTVFGRQGVSGLYFFFWDSQFGRFFNTGPIKGKGDKSFFLHTTLWAFLPWSLLLYAALTQWFRKHFRDARRHEWYCFFGSLATFLLFSLSRFQLPHYLNIVFPLFAIITAQYLFSLRSRTTLRAVNITQLVQAVLLVVLAMVIFWFFKPDTVSIEGIGLMVLTFAAILVIPAATLLQKALYRTALTAIFVNIFLNMIFYPNLLQYQSGSEAARWINKNHKGVPVVQFAADKYSYALEFYLDEPLIICDSNGQLPKKPFLVYHQAPLPIEDTGAVKLLKEWSDYPISRLTPKFLNKATRGEKTGVFKVVRVE
ncbi:MAG: glycosyltransferase family 39 protein [Chitinophagaceae bacterium]|nr:glycosyltransferase family 39 protein [Chitinophagaceae bacterium]